MFGILKMRGNWCLAVGARRESGSMSVKADRHRGYPK
jgi:hypothetical protein